MKYELCDSFENYFLSHGIVFGPNLEQKYIIFFSPEVQVTRKGNVQQRRVLRTVSSQTWKRHLISESFLPPSMHDGQVSEAHTFAR